MAYAAGVDVGSTQTKAVIIDENMKIVGRSLTDTGANVVAAAQNAYDLALADGSIGEEEVEFSYVTSDSGPYRARAFSCLHLISESAYQVGLTRLAEQAGSGGIRCVSRYVLLWGTRRTSHRNAPRHRDPT